VFARVDTVAGNRVRVTNSGQTRWTSETAWRLEEDLRLGAAATGGPEAEQFGDIGSIAVDSEGRIYILDALNQEIRVFDATGRYAHNIGGEGEGPGEFTFASEINVGPAEDVWVIDDGMSRYSVFALDGTLLETYPRRIIGRYSAFKGAVLDDGSYIDWGVEFPDGRFASRTFFHPIRYQPGFDSHDSLPNLEHHWEMMRSGRMPLTYFNGFPVGAVDGGGSIWFADSREYRVFRRSLEGDTTLLFTLPAIAPVVSQADRESIENQSFRSTDRRIEALESLPEEKPIVYRIVPDNLGHLYLFVDLAEEPAGTVVDVFQDNGVFLGRMHIPLSLPLSSRGRPIAHATAEHLYVVFLDELDVPHVSRMRIVKGRGG